MKRYPKIGTRVVVTDEAAYRAAELHAQGKKFCLVLVPVERKDGQVLYTVECREEP